MADPVTVVLSLGQRGLLNTLTEQRAQIDTQINVATEAILLAQFTREQIAGQQRQLTNAGIALTLNEPADV